jgi:WD40 repeat protein
MYPGGGICVTAGGRSVKIWDILGGYRLLETLTDHGKTVTGLSLDSARSRLFTAKFVAITHLSVLVYGYSEYTHLIALFLQFGSPS